MNSSSFYILPLGPAEECSDRTAGWAPGENQGHPTTTLYSTKSAGSSQPALPCENITQKNFWKVTAQLQPNYSSICVFLGLLVISINKAINHLYYLSDTKIDYCKGIQKLRRRHPFCNRIKIKSQFVLQNVQWPWFSKKYETDFRKGW